LRSPARSTSGKKECSSRGKLGLKIPRVVVAGLRGGSGKTTLSLGLLGALRRKGLAVAAFKKGPDYIDAAWLAQAAGAPCYNLDPFLIGKDKILPSFACHLDGAEFAVVEGNRGLFDGMDSEGSMSTAVVARELKAPVILIADCTKATRTVAATIYGVERFERGLKIGGVVLNHVAGGRHEAVIRESMEKYVRAPVLGAIPKLREMRMPERHMGLMPRHEHPDVESSLEWATALVEKHVDIDAVVRVAAKAPALAAEECPHPTTSAAKTAPRVGVVLDSAFQFYYPENFDDLRAQGAELVPVSALTDASLPPLDALYIGGGFPETHAIALSENVSFRNSLLRAAERGLPIYAECGGLIYLGQELIVGGKSYTMAGALPIRFELMKRPQAHGYTSVKVTRANPFFKKGAELRGHEFHYSRVTDAETDGPVKMAFRMGRGEGIAGGMDGMCYKNILATYTHLHALGFPSWAAGIVKAARRFRKQASG
jgi:cobyrinic acid a,c-diamide synthase